MSVGTVKVAISLPKATLDEIEHLRHKLKLPRSRVILEAVLVWLKQKREESLDRKYAAGYRKKPEDPKEVHPMYLAGLSSFGKDSW